MQNEFPAERVDKAGPLGKGDTSFPNRPCKYRKAFTVINTPGRAGGISYAGKALCY